MSERQVALVHDLSRQVLEQIAPSDVELLDGIWSVCEAWVRRGLQLAPREWARVGMAEMVPTSVGVIDVRDAAELPGPKALTAITAGISFLNHQPGATRADALRFIEEFGEEEGRYDEVTAQAAGVILAAHVEAVRRLGVSAGEHASNSRPIDRELPMTREGREYRVMIQAGGVKKEDALLTRDEVADIWRRYDRECFPVVVDEPSGEVKLAGGRMRVSSKPLRLLVELLLARGVPVTHEELLSGVFPDEADVYDKKNVAMTKYSLCIALGVKGERCDDYIEDVPGVGYRWVGADTYLLVCRATRGK